MTADARTVDERIDLVRAAARLTGFANSTSCPPEVANAIDTVMTRLNELTAAALPTVDMDAFKHTNYDEWYWGGAPHNPLVNPRITAYNVPGEDDVILWLPGGRTVKRAELDQLVAFLTAVRDGSSEQALDARYACDCAPDGDGHESWCATVADPRRAS